MSVSVFTLKQMVKYPLSVIVHVFISLILVVAGCQTFPIFPTQDLT